MSVVLSVSRSQWSVAADKIIFPSIRLPDVICVELVYQHHSCRQRRGCTVSAGPVGVYS